MNLFLVHIAGAFLLCPHMVEGLKDLWSICYKGTNPIYEVSILRRPSFLGVWILIYEFGENCFLENPD